MFALVDCNNFYASCERAFNPAIRRRPVIVLSNNDGCVIARSNEAKALGFNMGDPFFKMRPLVERHQVAVFSSNYTLYGDMSRRVMETLEQFAPEIETYSIDEAFLNLAGFEPKQLAAHAEEIRRTVLRWTGIPVSVGIGKTKTLAKAANQLAKRSPAAQGVWIIYSEQQRQEALSLLAAGDVWGIGRRWAKFLYGHGVETAADFASQPDRWIRQHLNVIGLRTATELRGTPCISLELAPPPKKGLVVSRMFGKRLTDIEPVREALISYVTRAGEKLRRDRLTTRHMEVFIQNSPFAASEPFYANASNFQLPHATSDTAELIRHACTGLRQIFRPGYHYAKCGVMLTELVAAGSEQRDLFADGGSERSNRLMAAIDGLNSRMGRDTVSYAGSGIGREWLATASMKSQHFSTDWREVISIKLA